MNKPAQIIVTPSGERLAVLPEEDYLLLLAASEDDEGEASPEFLDMVRRRRQEVAERAGVVTLEAIRAARPKSDR